MCVYADINFRFLGHWVILSWAKENLLHLQAGWVWTTKTQPDPLVFPNPNPSWPMGKHVVHLSLSLIIWPKKRLCR